MKLITITILLIFFIFRNSFTLIKGKRNIKNVTSFIYVGRKLIEIGIFFIVPILVLLEIVKPLVYLPFYYLGVAISIVGLLLMIWTRLNRNKDWGFMGDSSGSELFTGGPYQVTRHPYYMGAIFVGVGVYLQLHYIFVFLTVPTILFVMHVIRKEDVFLEKEFGSKFVEYKNKVGLFPWFY